ncbi:hypothetical protein ABW19_dt0206358 [Dactylella cylindrospora]|nr:hypothetical protein ABW19_dt0206358 [Dactylella cylindrospora]
MAHVPGKCRVHLTWHYRGGHFGRWNDYSYTQDLLYATFYDKESAPIPDTDVDYPLCAPVAKVEEVEGKVGRDVNTIAPICRMNEELLDKYLLCDGNTDNPCKWRVRDGMEMSIVPQHIGDYVHFYYGDQNWRTGPGLPGVRLMYPETGDTVRCPAEGDSGWYKIGPLDGVMFAEERVKERFMSTDQLINWRAHLSGGN